MDGKATGSRAEPEEIFDIIRTSEKDWLEKALQLYIKKPLFVCWMMLVLV